MFKFVADNVGGVGTKRKQSFKSCDSCKRRHKRCSHGDQSSKENHSIASSSPDSPRGHRLRNEASPQSNHAQITQGSNHNSGIGPYNNATNAITRPNPPENPPAKQGGTEQQQNEAHIRFVANLSPESAFIINANRRASRGDISTHGVGLWLGQKPEDVPSENASIDEQTVSLPSDLLNGLPRHDLLLSVIRPALRRECMSTIPPEESFRALHDLFFQKIDPVFPLLRDEPWERHNAMETVALKQCICLVAALDPAMRPYLRLPHTDKVLSQLEFRARIAAVVKQTLDLGFITDKVVLLQVCTLMSMYVENQGFGELSTYYCAQAVLHEQTLGFHVGWPDGMAGGERSRRIFWCVWVLDRLNAATNGRPTLIHRSDMDKKVMDSADNQAPPFKLLIRVAYLLEYTISLYRPQTMLEHDEAMDQTFEDLVEATGAHDMGNGPLASLELFYLSMVVLRGNSAGKRSSSELQWFCAARIVAIASGEFKKSLLYWPFLPFAVTVAASVAYKSLRNSPLPYNRRRAYKLFQESCEVLDDLSQAFLSARSMARLAMETMQEVERVATERTRKGSIRHIETPAATGLDDASEQRHQQQQGQGQQHIQNKDDQTPESRYTVQQRASDDMASNNAYSTHPAAFSDYLGPDFFSELEGEAGIFGSLDPNFDLGRIDAIFSANLDLRATHVAENWLEHA